MTRVKSEGNSAADKVVGDGAAFLYVLLEVNEIYANVISKSTFVTLMQHQMPVTCGVLTDAIRNLDKIIQHPAQLNRQLMESPLLKQHRQLSASD